MNRIFWGKQTLTTVEGLAAQLCLHSNLSRRQEVASVGEDPLRSFTNIDCTVLFSHHFAIPTRENYSLYLNPYAVLQLGDGTAWMNEPTLFVGCEEDPWLYLLLGGGKHPQMEPWRYFSHRTVQTLTTNTVLTFLRDMSHTSATVQVENSEAMARQGDNLELLAALATIIASRCNGVRGATWWDFLRHLTTHLVCDISKPLCDMQWGWDLSPQLASMETLVGGWVVPFLGPLNSPWPEVFKTMPDVRLGDVQRGPNKDRLDLTVTGSPGSLSFTGECKNYQGPVGITIIKGIFDRIPSGSQFHLVVVSALQKTYSLSREDRDESFATTNVVKVVAHREDRTLSFAQAWPAMDLVPWDACTRLVVFGHLNSPTQRRGKSSSARFLSDEPPPKRANTNKR